MDAELRAIAEPRRREILRLIWSKERTAGEIARNFDVSRPAISQHLRVLREAGLVTEITRWRDPAVKPHRGGPLPEPPRTHHVSKTETTPKDRVGRELEDWLSDLTVVSTADAE